MFMAIVSLFMWEDLVNEIGISVGLKFWYKTHLEYLASSYIMIYRFM